MGRTFAMYLCYIAGFVDARLWDWVGRAKALICHLQLAQEKFG
jgi:hypothetical protein